MLVEVHAQVVVFALVVISKHLFLAVDQSLYFVIAQWIEEGLAASVLVAYPVPICTATQPVALADPG